MLPTTDLVQNKLNQNYLPRAAEATFNHCDAMRIRLAVHWNRTHHIWIFLVLQEARLLVFGTAHPVTAVFVDSEPHSGTLQG